MAKVRLLPPILPPTPPKSPVPFVSGGFYTESGSTYFIMDANEKAIRVHAAHCLVAVYNGKKVTPWMTKEEMEKFINKKDKNFIYRDDAEVVIPLEPWETGI